MKNDFQDSLTGLSMRLPALDAARDARTAELAGEVIFEHRISILMEKEPSCQQGMNPKARSGAWHLPHHRGVLCCRGSRLPPGAWRCPGMALPAQTTWHSAPHPQRLPGIRRACGEGGKSRVQGIPRGSTDREQETGRATR